MEDNTEIQQGNTMGKERTMEKSPEEIRQQTKEKVAKGMAAVVGSTEGFVQNHEPQAMADAARVTAQTVRSTTEAVKEEAQAVRQDLGIPQRSPSAGSQGPSMGEKVGERVHGTTSQMKERAREVGQQAKEKGRELGQQAKEKGREIMQEESPDAVRQKARESSGRVFAAGTGAAEGWVEQSHPESAGQAVHKVGETVRESGKAVKEEIQKGKSGSSTAGKTGTGSTDYGGSYP